MTSLILILLMAQQQGTALTASVAVRPELIVDPSVPESDRIALQEAYATSNLPTLDPDGNPAPPCDKLVLRVDDNTYLSSKPGLVTVTAPDPATGQFFNGESFSAPTSLPCPVDGWPGQPVDGLVEFPDTLEANGDPTTALSFPRTAPPRHTGTGPIRRSGMLAESSYSPSIIECFGQFAVAEDSHYSPYATHNDNCYLYVVPWVMWPRVLSTSLVEERWFNAADIGFQVSHKTKNAAAYILFGGRTSTSASIIKEGSKFSSAVNAPRRILWRKVGLRNEYRIRFEATMWWKATYGENRGWQRWDWVTNADDIIYGKFASAPVSWVRCTSIAQTVEGASTGFHKNVKWEDSFGYDGTTKRSWNQIFNASQALKFSQDYPSNPATPQTKWKRPSVVTWFSSSNSDRFAEVVSVDTRPVP